MASIRFSPRVRLIAYFLLLIGGLFVARLFYLQIIQHDYYTQKAVAEHVNQYTLFPTRGIIYAKDGETDVPLVLNQSVFTVFADPTLVKNPDHIADVIRKVAGGEAVKNLDDVLKRTDTRYQVLARQVSKDQKNLIAKEHLAGVNFQESQQRVYPEGSLAAQLLGYVNSEGEGQYGIEGALNDKLAGKPGVRKATTDVNNVPLLLNSTDDVDIPAVNGQNVVLSIDRNIQSFTEQALREGLKSVKATKGSVLIMDPNTGKVLAMANQPSYDPTHYNEVSDYSVFLNGTVSHAYEPASVMKTFVMATGLDQGVITPDTTYNNTYKVVIDGWPITNSTYESLGTTTMYQVLMYSLNTGSIFVLEQLGGGNITPGAKATLYDYFHNRFHLGQLTGIEQTGENEGIVYSPTSQEGSNVRYANMTFGQGLNLTMIQVCTAFSAAINGGTLYKPTLVDGYMDDSGEHETAQAPTVVSRGVVKQSTSDQLKHMLVVARASIHPADKPGYAVGGKTGTSQTVNPETGAYYPPNAGHTVASYIGYGGGSEANPQYVVMVRVDDSKLPGSEGSISAQPIFTTISNWLLEYKKVVPGK
jgi:cell division protein FtsI/penicillin-binding protein 2